MKIHMICCHVIAMAALLGVSLRELDGAPPGQSKWADQTLKTTDGTTILAKFDGKGYTAFVTSGKTEGPLRDGEYKLSNGGAIRVKGGQGQIVWDAFGAIERLKGKGTGANKAQAPIGLG